MDTADQLPLLDVILHRSEMCAPSWVGPGWKARPCLRWRFNETGPRICPRVDVKAGQTSGQSLWCGAGSRRLSVPTRSIG